MAGVGNDPGTYGDTFGVAFQTHMLAVMIRHPGCVIRFRSAIDPSFFSFDEHRIISRALLAHIDKYRSLPSRPTLTESVRAISTKQTLEIADKLLKSIYGRDVSDAAAVQDKIVEFGKLQAAVNATMLNSEDLNHGDRSKILQRMRDAAIVGEDITDLGVDYTASQDVREQWYTQAEQDSCVPTGMYHLDRMLRGGGRRGDLHAIAAITGKGKTTTLVNVAHGGAIAGANVVYYTIGDLSRVDVSMRLDDRLAGDAFQYKETDPARYVRLLNERCASLMRGRIIVQHYNRHAVGITQLRSHLSLLEAGGFKPDVVICDYASVLKAERRVGNTWEEIGGIYEDFNTLVGEYNSVGWSGVQVPQRSYSKPILELGDLAGSAEIGEHAALVLTFNQTRQDEIDNIVRLYGAKVRRKEDHGVVIAHVNKPQCKITTTAWLNSAGTLVSGKYEGESAGTEEQREEEAQRAAMKARVLRRVGSPVTSAKTIVVKKAMKKPVVIKKKAA